MSTTKTAVTVHCDSCRRILPTNRSTAKGARGDASRRGWKVAGIYSGDPSANPRQLDLCPECVALKRSGAHAFTAHHHECPARTLGGLCNCDRRLP